MTLIELLLVIAIVLTLLCFALPSVTGITGASKLTKAGQLVGDQFQLARQYAVTKNQNIQVRIYKTHRTDEAADSYCATAIFQLPSDGSSPQILEPVAYLPSGIAIAQNDVLSSLLDQFEPTELDPKFGKNYRSLTFRPNGSVEIINAKSWLTIVKAHEIDVASLPKNYYTIKVVPANGIVKTFRP